jgi:regulatory protein
MWKQRQLENALKKLLRNLKKVKRIRKKQWATKPLGSSKNPSADKAYNSLLRRITRRDLSEKEIWQKLSPYYADEAITAAVTKAKNYNLLKPAAELAQRWAQDLNRRGKGELYIRQSLKNRGLPLPELDEDVEINKCRAQIEKKWGQDAQFTFEERAKVFRYLTNRGFQLETIKKALNK